MSVRIFLKGRMYWEAPGPLLTPNRPEERGRNPLRFTEHDLRAKVASDTTLDHAKQLMGHSNEMVTERVYRRGKTIVEPAS